MDATLGDRGRPRGPGRAADRRGQDVLRRRRPQGLRRAATTSPPTCARSWRRSTSAITNLVRGDAPVVAAVQGSAAGAGMGFVGASDLVVAAESAKFVMAYTGVGLTPDGSSSWFLPRLVGLRRALELTLTNRVLSAAEALDWGLITAGRARRRARRHGRGRSPRKLAAGPPPALARGQAAAAHEPRRRRSRPHLAREAEAISSASGTPEGIEGVAAFVEKRKPVFNPLSSGGPSRGTVASSAARWSSSLRAQRVVVRAEDAHRQQPGVARLAHADRGDGDAVGHLHDRQQGVEAVEVLQRHGHADHRERRHRRGHARQVRGTTGAGDDHAAGRVAPRCARTRTSRRACGAPTRPAPRARRRTR